MHTKGGILKADNALAMTDGRKVDYVVTGNVLNSPDNYEPDDMILACANLLKRGGRAIHLLAYGEGKSFSWIGNHDLEAFAGQMHLYNIPEGDYRPQAMAEIGNTQMMVLEQAREVQHTRADLEKFHEDRNASLNKPPVNSVPSGGRQITPSANARGVYSGRK
jgi:hypothetical protein